MRRRSLPRHDRARAVIVALATTLSSLFAAATPAFAGDETRSQQQRAVLGLPADLETIRDIRAEGLDVGMEDWGFVITAAEKAAVEARMQRAQAVEEDVATHVRDLPSYGGMYYEDDGTHLVIQLAIRDARLEADLTSRMPKGTSVEFESVARPYAVLEAATKAVFDAWASTTSLTPAPYHAGLDTRANLVRVFVDAAIIDSAKALQADFEDALGVPVAFAIGEPAEGQACSSRNNCTNPIKSAVIIRKGSTTGSPCTMAFQVRKGSDEQFLTAAHCALSGSNNWYHAGWGLLGSEQQTLWSSGYDAVRIGFPDSQTTAWMYGDGYVVGWAWPSVGDVLIQNQAVSNTIYFTEVTDDWHCWTYSGQQLCGARMAGVGGVGGDSGSPLYRFFTSTLYAVGINFGGCGGGCMTRIGDVLSRMGVTLVTGP